MPTERLGADAVADFPCFVQDVETYDVSPIDPVNDMAVRKRLEAFLSWGEFGTEAELPGPCLDGKEFK